MSERDIGFLEELERIIRERLATGDESSYTARLAMAGDRRIAQKVGEEAVELALAAVAGSRDEQLEEAADLIYHLLVLLSRRDIRLADVAAVLTMRHRA
ncbi:MAG: phosphoribosyl-ATP diphosphatase [Gammaproteobacteria bacterium]|nr:phosphoribosyl-ATP diphosphatase [Gammaproteobacteria bacterium]MDH5344845.1 phosphoribosyl-ATP diphosphatase [Gammaproteobacteria bacterium]